MSDEKPLVRVDIGSPLSFKTEIKAEIPKESSGRLLDALTDVIRPFTERRGLRADMIRLQREDVLIEIARRARKRLEVEGRNLNPLPNKFLVPFLEKASTEDPNSDLVEAWANLLAAASEKFSAAHIHFANVLAEIGATEAEMLRRLVQSDRVEDGIPQKEPHFIEDAYVIFEGTIAVDALWLRLYDVVPADDPIPMGDLDEVIQSFIKENEGPGAVVTVAGILADDHREMRDEDGKQVSAFEVHHPQFAINDKEDEMSFSILERLGLIDRKLFSSPWDDISAHVSVIHLTHFGIKFYLACNPDLERDIERRARGFDE